MYYNVYGFQALRVNLSETGEQAYGSNQNALAIAISFLILPNQRVLIDN